ncbi:MAG: AAA family ATPase [Burkholderiales bacterium RIFCSPHIGHO2_12_FULL_67_38]|nr:MAG: AAA family ATPase [Burkholderiales bacterium RIFCSPLOWO2_02_FULL_67_64]OGB52184.1 MAG: AAA family ATPase [Burkholderiales bacterium RIFCSPHIGHO2_12_FULL_67_38]
MNARDTTRAPTDWTEANQRLLSAEFARIKGRLRGEDEAAAQARLEQCREELDQPAAIDQLVERFDLSRFERDILLLAAGVEMDSEIGALCAGASPSGQRPWATFGLALAVLPDPHWSALTPVRPLRLYRMLDIAEETALVTARLRLDERVLHFLAGIGFLDTRLQPLMQRVAEPDLMAQAQRQTALHIVAEWKRAGPALPVVQLPGKDPHGKRDVAAHAAAQLGLQLYAIQTDDLPTPPQELDALVWLWQREAVLSDAALLIECCDTPLPPQALRFVERIGGVCLIAAPEPVALARRDLRVRVDKPGASDQRHLWRAALGASAEGLRHATTGVAAEFRLSTHDIQRIAQTLDPRSDDAALERSLWQACRGLESRRMAGLAQHIEAVAGWDDLVLPEPQKATLREIASHLRHRTTVHEHWGFAGLGARGLGIAALFAGESGTGKTLAAEVLANELHLDLYRIDLSAVVSKYIGETEKNLARVFDVAEDSGAVLLFDEADALFGKRSEVKDSHDRYANIEVSYLLQRMEAYRGLAILTTNQKTALDPAFHRRLRFVVHFPFPEASEREAIWRRVFPGNTPTAGLDHARLSRLQMAGGNIRNIALNAAFHAAEDAQPIGMGHVLRAAQAEALKRERPLSDAETRGWA